jgi:hypothetical protein
MKRRTFVESLGGISIMTSGMAEPLAAAARKPNFFSLETYYLRNGTQGPRINEFFSQGLLPALSKFHGGAKIFLEGLVAAHMPQFVVILGFDSLEELSGVKSRLRQDAAYQKAFAAWESGPEAPYEHYTQSVLKAAEYSPAIEPVASAKPRVFELRTYHSPTWKQLAALHQRFAGPEIKIFHRCGVHPVLYSETLFGANMPNLTYLTPFDDLAARDKAWSAFAADPEWVKVRKESIDAHGQISSVIQITLLRAAPYSPLR